MGLSTGEAGEAMWEMDATAPLLAAGAKVSRLLAAQAHVAKRSRADHLAEYRGDSDADAGEV